MNVVSKAVVAIPVAVLALAAVARAGTVTIDRVFVADVANGVMGSSQNYAAGTTFPVVGTDVDTTSTGQSASTTFSISDSLSTFSVADDGATRNQGFFDFTLGQPTDITFTIDPPTIVGNLDVFASVDGGVAFSQDNYTSASPGPVSSTVTLAAGAHEFAETVLGTQSSVVTGSATFAVSFSPAATSTPLPPAVWGGAALLGVAGLAGLRRTRVVPLA